LMALPVVLLWLRWRAFHLPRSQWVRPLPWIAATPIAFAACIALFFLGFRLEKELGLPPGIGNWLPIATFALWAAVTKWCRPLMLAGLRQRAD
jgi:hypothetical protein